MFKRENRYIVIKRKDLDLLSDEAKDELENILIALSIAKQPDIDTGAEGAIECVVVEKDWPMYEQTWKSIEDWAAQKSEDIEEQSKRIEELEADMEKYRNAMLGIKKHYEFTVPNGYNLTTAWNIANKTIGNIDE